jgi:hypothetical protein
MLQKRIVLGLTRKKISESRKQYFLEHPEARQSLSECRKLWHKNHPNAVSGEKNGMHGKGFLVIGKKNPFYGRRHTDETKRIIGMKSRGRLMSASSRLKISMTKRARIAKGLIVFHKGEKHPFFGKHHSVETKQKISVANTGRKFPVWVNKKKGLAGAKNPFYGKKHSQYTLRQILRMVNNRPNKFECAVYHFLDSRYPNEWKYCGDGSFIINGHCPDFIRCSGEKKVILANGSYWHAGCNRPSLTLKRKIEQKESKPYNEFGFKVWFIWEDEFKEKKINV